MSEIISNLLMAIICVAVPCVSAAIISAVNKIVEQQAEKTESALAQGFLAEISEAVSTAVTATSQTYVDALKEADAFTSEAQQTALQMALSTCLSSISESAKKFIQNSYGDITDYLVNKIEAAVKAQKN